MALISGNSNDGPLISWVAVVFLSGLGITGAEMTANVSFGVLGGLANLVTVAGFMGVVFLIAATILNALG